MLISSGGAVISVPHEDVRAPKLAARLISIQPLQVPSNDLASVAGD